MIAEALRLPDSEWIENWDFLLQTLLATVSRRAEMDDPANGRLTATAILEQLVEKRAVLPPEKDVTYTALYLYQSLYLRYFVRHDWDKAIALSKLHLNELKNLDIGHVPEQESMVWYQMATCENLRGHTKEAQQDLQMAFSFLVPETLPPHRFKQHLLNLIELCHRHDMFEQPVRRQIEDDSTPPVEALSFLSAAKHFYDTLGKQFPNLQSDTPWERIIDGLETTMEAQMTDAKEDVTLERNVDVTIGRSQMDRLLRIQYWMDNIVSNPKYTPKQRIYALKKLMRDSKDLSPTEIERLNRFLRTLRAVAELPQEYTPKDPSERPQRFK